MTIANSLKELVWKDVRNEVYAVNPTLAKIIDELNPSDKYTLFKGTYAFGDEIISDGRLYIPNKNGLLIPFNSPDVTPHIQESLGYNLGTNPVSLILSGSAEIFMILEHHTIPLYGLIKPGRIFSTWKVISEFPSLGPAFLWDMTAGARSFFLLAKVSKATAHKRLVKEFNLQTEKSKGILDHWHIFRELANHPNFGQTWKTEILFFSKIWFDNLNDKAFQNFQTYLYKTAWEGSNFWRHQFIWKLVFSLIQKELDIKPATYIDNIAKHLLAMGIGALPGYTPAIDDSAGPVKRLQEIYNSIYSLEQYVPIIMQPYTFNLEVDRPAYFSFQYPNTIEFANKSREDSSKLTDLILTKSLLNKYLINLTRDELRVEQTPVYELPKLVQFDFYHTESQSYSDIKNSRVIGLEDPNFAIPADQPDLFPANSSFLRGCVRISKKKKP